MSTATARSTTNENIFAINSQHLSRFSTSKYKLKTIIDDVTSSSSLHLDRSIAYCKYFYFIFALKNYKIYTLY